MTDRMGQKKEGQLQMSSETYEFGGEKFEIVVKDCSLEVRLSEKKKPEVYGKVVPSNKFQSPFSGQLHDINGRIRSQSARTVEEALRVACDYVLAYQEPNQEKACKDIKEFFDKLP